MLLKKLMHIRKFYEVEVEYAIELQLFDDRIIFS